MMLFKKLILNLINHLDFACVSIKYTDDNWRPVRNWKATYPNIFNIIFGRQISFWIFCKKINVYKYWLL